MPKAFTCEGIAFAKDSRILAWEVSPLKHRGRLPISLRAGGGGGGGGGEGEGAGGLSLELLNLSQV